MLAACGKKGPPLAPLRVAPARIEDLTVIRVGDTVRAQFTIPSANDDKSTPADVAAIELHALTGEPQDELGQTLNGADLVRFSDTVGRLEVKPVLIDAPPEAEALAKADPRPEPGQAVTLTETLTAASRTPFVHPRTRTRKPPPEVDDDARPLAGPPAERPLARVYVATAISRKGVRSAVSNRVAAPLDSPPVTPPPLVNVDHDASNLGISWEYPADAAVAVQRAPAADEIPAKPLVSSRLPTTYNVYQVTQRDGVAEESIVAVNPAPIPTNGVITPIATLSGERCFVVRSGMQYGRARVEGPPSPVKCIELRDKFPPAAPKGLVAVGSEGGVSLIWDGNSEPDLAGYLVLRGEVGPAGAAETLTPIIQEPLKETTYRDTTVRPGVRYVYAVVAVDGASPRNVSAESNRVEEGAR